MHLTATPRPAGRQLCWQPKSHSDQSFNLLLRYGGDPFHTDAEGMNCLSIATAFGAAEVIGCVIAVFRNQITGLPER